MSKYTIQNMLCIFLVRSDIQKIAVYLQCAVSLVSEYLLRKDLTELYALLIEGVQVPAEALEHHLVLIVCEQCAEGSRIQLLTDDDRGRTATLEVLVAVFVFLTAGEGNDLGGNIGTELLLAGAALDGIIHADLVLTEADELERDDVLALVQELVEAVLAVGARLTEDNRTGRIVHRLTEAVY